MISIPRSACDASSFQHTVRDQLRVVKLAAFSRNSPSASRHPIGPTVLVCRRTECSSTLSCSPVLYPVHETVGLKLMMKRYHKQSSCLYCPHSGIFSGTLHFQLATYAFTFLHPFVTASCPPCRRTRVGERHVCPSAPTSRQSFVAAQNRY